MKRKDRDLPPNWPRDWPQNLEEFRRVLKSDGLVEYLEDRGISLRYDEKTDRVIISREKR